MRQRLWLPAVIALGANLGDRETTLRAAVADIAAIDGVRLEAASGIVESHAMKLEGVDEQAPNYLNAVVRVSCALQPERLLAELNRIESEHGRVRIERWGDRTLDLDIVTFSAFQQNDERLTLPHPRAWERPFVLVPWLQIQPDAVLPGRGPIADLAAAHSDEVWQFAASPLVTA